MKTRKRGRSPDQDCRDCLPISKRITRLNIQSTSRTSTDDQDTNSPHCLGPGVSSTQCNGENGNIPWQHDNQSSGFITGTGNNNNLDCIPCGSSQCESVQTLTTKNSICNYAARHGIPKEDLNGYSPELTQTENPHYFQANRLLYQAHLDKANRQGLPEKNPF